MFSDNALVKPVKGKVKIKVEPDDSNEPHIQLEAIDENENQEAKNEATAYQKLLEEHMRSKKQISNMFFEMQKNKEMTASLQSEKKSLSDQLNSLRAGNKALMEEVEKVQTEFKSVKSENNHLTAVVDQLRKGIDQTETIDQQKSDDENSNNNSFEVEQLIKYRKKNRKPQFLVRWADSWVDEKNLNCRELLQNYYATKNLK